MFQSQDHEEEIPAIMEISKIPLSLNKVGPLLGHFVVSAHTQKVNGVSSTYLQITHYITL